MTRFGKTMTAIALGAGGLTAVVVAAANLGLDFPKFATQSHVAAGIAKTDAQLKFLAGSVKTNRMLSLENAIAADERRAGDLEIQAIQLEQMEQNSRAIRDQVKRLRRAVRQRELELNGLRR